MAPSYALAEDVGVVTSLDHQRQAESGVGVWDLMLTQVLFQVLRCGEKESVKKFLPSMGFHSIPVYVVLYKQKGYKNKVICF